MRERLERWLDRASRALRRGRIRQIIAAATPTVWPKKTCRLCLDVLPELDEFLADTTVSYAGFEKTDRELRAHILAAVGIWWTAHTLALHNRDPFKVFEGVIAFLSENGIAISTDLLTPGPQVRPSRVTH